MHSAQYTKAGRAERFSLLRWLVVGAGLLLLFGLPGGAIATSGREGAAVRITATSCSSDSHTGWQGAEKATGFSDADIGVRVDDVALATDGGAQLVCSGFQQTSDHKVDPVLIIDLLDEADLDFSSNDLLTINDPNTGQTLVEDLPSAVEPQQPDQLGLDDWLRVDTSEDGGLSWQPFHAVKGSDDVAQSLAIRMDPELFVDMDALQVRLELLDGSRSVAVDSIGLGYRVGPDDIVLNEAPGDIKISADESVVGIGQVLELNLQADNEDHGLWQGLEGLVSAESAPEGASVDVVVYDNGQELADIDYTSTWQERGFSGNDVWNLEVKPPATMKPGKKTVTVTVSNDNSIRSISQDFLWGVLALNTNKSVYAVGEVGRVDMTVLDNHGATICDSDLQLDVLHDGKNTHTFSTAGGSLAPSETCPEYGGFITPDYSAVVTFDQLGSYQFVLRSTTAAGTRVITDEVLVEQQPLVSIERTGPTRIYPKVDYAMRLTTAFSEPFSGTVVERVPAAFVISPDSQSRQYDSLYAEEGVQYISWNVVASAGETIALGYRFDAPDIAPEFYLLGPLELLDLAGGAYVVEHRPWQIASDAVGDIAIYREATATDVIAGAAGTLTANYDTTVRQDAIYTINGADNAVDLGDAGHYLVMHSASFDDAAGAGRREINTNIDINGTNSAYGRSTCYIRTANGSNECWQQGAAIIEVAANDDISIEHARTDNQGAGNTVTRRANESGLSLLKLNDNWDYARIQEAGGGQSFAGQGFINVDWDTNDELDSGSFARTGSDITLKQKGHYLVTSNIKFNTTAAGTGTGARRAVESRLVLDGSPVVGTNVTAYIRGGNNDYDHALAYIGIVETLEPNQVLQVQGACTSLECSGVISTGGQTAITIAKLPDNADFIRLHNSAGGQAVDGTNAPVLWDTQDEVDAAAFSHSTATNTSRINIDQADDYLFAGSFLSDRFGSANGGRQYPHWEWRTNGTTTVQHSGFGKFNRGNQGTSGDYSSGASGGFLGSNLTATDYVELINTDEATSTDALNTFQADKYAVQGVALTSLFATEQNTRQEHFRWRDDSAALNTATGFLAAEDDNAIGDISAGSIYRLRMAAANVRTANESAARTYELQFAEKTEAHCELQSVWVGVSDSSSDAFEHQATSGYGENDATAALLANSEGYTFVPGRAVDEGDTTLAVGPLSASPNQYTELEFAFVATTDSTVGSTYCFRLYDTTAATPLDSYGRYPEAKVASSDTTQAHFRWRDDSVALNTSGGFLAAEDSNAIGAVDKQAVYRLRMEVYNDGTAAERAARDYQLQYADRERFTACTNIAEGSWIGVDAAADAVDLYDVDNINNGQAATAGLLANAEGHTFVDGQGLDSTATADPIGPLASGEYTELEFGLQLTEEAVTGHSYCFRLYDSAAAETLDSYDVYPEIGITGVSLPTGVRGEAGVIESAADGGWLTIAFENTYVTPVIIGQVTTEREDGVMIVEFRNVGATSAEVRACDTDGGSGSDCETHIAESLSYMVVDADTTDDFDGIEAGTANRGGNAQSNTGYPSETFGAAPYVFANVQNGSAQPIETRINGVTTGLFGLSVCDQTAIDTCSGAGPTRSVGWIAIEPGGAGLAPFNVEHNDGTINLANSFVNSVTYASPFTELPAVFAEESTNDTANNVHIDRVLDVTTTGARVGFCEHENDDNCGGDTAETVRYFAIEQGVFGRPSIDLTTYRWYDAENANTPTSPRGAVNTSIDGVSGGGAAGQPRLRTALQVGVADFEASTDGFRLQFGTKATTCSAVAAWTTLGGTAGGTIWRGDAIAGPPADGDALLASVLNGAANQLQALEEQNDTAVNPVAIDRGQRGEWDWSIDENGAAAATEYCFRIVTDGDDILTYTNYPELNTAANTAPDVPAGLDQRVVVTQASLATGNWTDDSQLEFGADLSDTDNPDTLELCVEVQPVGAPFTGTDTQCSNPQSYSGVAVAAELTLTGLSDATEYHWQARTRDNFGATSAWVSFGANLETDSDFGIDSSAPTGGAVYDGPTANVDVDFNTGSLSTLEANWSGIDASASGLAQYEYAIGTTSGGDDVQAWTSTGTTALFSNSSLSLDTQTTYYVSVRTTDVAGNVSTPITSDGILVAPSLSFSSSSSPVGIDFGSLEPSNSYTSTNAVTLTTSTNAYGGYVIRSYATGLLVNGASTTFPMFNGGSYASPDAWLPGDTGWGYTSNDTTIQGSDIFNPGGGACAGGGTGPCYVPFSTTQPGDIVADHTTTVSGTPVVGEAFVVTHQVTADPSQEQGIYSSTIIYNVSANY